MHIVTVWQYSCLLLPDPFKIDTFLRFRFSPFVQKGRRRLCAGNTVSVIRIQAPSRGSFACLAAAEILGLRAHAIAWTLYIYVVFVGTSHDDQLILRWFLYGHATWKSATENHAREVSMEGVDVRFVVFQLWLGSFMVAHTVATQVYVLLLLY